MRKDIFLLRDALALGKHVPEIELSFCHSLICSTKIPHHFLSIALRNALPLAIYDPEIELRGWIALVSSFPGIAPCSVELCEAVVAVNDVKRPSQFGQERDCWSPFRSERQARPARQEVACRL